MAEDRLMNRAGPTTKRIYTDSGVHRYIHIYKRRYMHAAYLHMHPHVCGFVCVCVCVLPLFRSVTHEISLLALFACKPDRVHCGCPRE